jgi:hypothetical protein
MSDEFDRKLIPQVLQDALTIGLGASHKALEAMKSPQESAGKIFDEAKSLFVVPDDAGEGLEDKAKAVAAVWMEKGATWMEDCRSAGAKFTEDDKKDE